MKKLMEVEIFGQTFTVTSEDDEQYVGELASYVDERMRQMAGSAKTVVPFRVALMAALSIADDYFKASRRETEIRQETERLSSLLLDRIEESEKFDGLTAQRGAAAHFSNPSSDVTVDGGEKKTSVLPS